MESIPVDHCSHAFGLRLDSEAGWKLVFSADTRPCNAVVRAAENALLLIHEVMLVAVKAGFPCRRSMSCNAGASAHGFCK